MLRTRPRDKLSLTDELELLVSTYTIVMHRSFFLSVFLGHFFCIYQAAFVLERGVCLGHSWILHLHEIVFFSSGREGDVPKGGEGRWMPLESVFEVGHYIPPFSFIPRLLSYIYPEWLNNCSCACCDAERGIQTMVENWSAYLYNGAERWGGTTVQG